MFEFVNEPLGDDDYYKMKYIMNNIKSRQTFINFLIEFSKNRE